MDALTHILLALVITEAWFRKSLGFVALFFAIFCALLPDIDYLLYDGQTLSGLNEQQSRTHSLILLTAVSPLISGVIWIIDRWKRQEKRGSYRTWTHLAFWSLVSHPLLEVFTPRGTQIFYPMTTQRYAVDAIGVIDPMYTLPLLFASFWSLQHTVNRRTSRWISRMALLVSSMYVSISYGYSTYIIQKAKSQFLQIGFTPRHIRAIPPVGFFPIRRAIARDEKGSLITATYSIFSSRPPISSQKALEMDPLIEQVLSSKKGKIFAELTGNFVAVERTYDEIRLIDARYAFFTNQWESPFSTTIPIQPSGELGILKIDKRKRYNSLNEEFRAGWQVMLGQKEYTKADQDDTQ